MKTNNSNSPAPTQAKDGARCSLSPISIKAARHYVEKHHRHNKPPLGGLFAVGVKAHDELCGVAIIGRPIARKIQDGTTCEVVRLCTDGTKNACSMLYGAAARAAKALGYHRIITYILETEPGTSLKASGWMHDKYVPPRKSWSSPSRHRIQKDLFGVEQRPTCAKVRYVRHLV